MSKMRKTFEEVTPGSSNFIYMESTGEYIWGKLVKAYSPEAPKNSSRLAEFNEKWFYWQIAWQGGGEEPVLTVEDVNDEMVESLLDLGYVEPDYDRGVGPVDTHYQLSNNFPTREAGRFVVRFVLERYKQLKAGFLPDK